MRRFIVACCVASLFFVGTRSANGAPAINVPPIGESVDDLVAKDVLGTTHALSQIDRHKTVVLVFLGVECPLAKLYTPRLVEIARNYVPKGVVFFGVDANRQDSVTEIAAYARREEITFPILKDLRQTIANRVGATRTPQAVVLDRNRRICYRGRVDDQFGFVPTNRTAGYHKTKPDRNDLQIALDEVLAGKPVSVPETEAAGCLIGRDRVSPVHSNVTYTKDVAPILNKRCVSCHRPNQIAPFALTSYEEVAGWADMIVEVTESGRMPPWHADPKYGTFRNDCRLTEAERLTIARWAAGGAPKGDQQDLPAAPKFAEGWIIPKPDEIHYMSPQPYQVPATGVIPYQDFVIDPGWKEDRWICAIEPRPGNPAVVHHILFFVIPPEGGVPDLREDDTYLATYVPGMQPEPLATGYARLVRAGSKFMFDIHYTPNGRPQEDRSYVGIKFADPNSVRREVTVSSAFNKTFRISPGATNYEVHSQYVFQRDSLLLSLIPHMHYRGKDFVFEADYPDGRRETLLSVPRYDFGWQTVYRLAEPKLLPQGTIIKCVAHYDNSDANLNNPNPKVAVAWGEQSFDEMMIGFFEISPAADGLVHRTPWWAPIARRWKTIATQISAKQLVAVVLTMVTLFLVSALVVDSVRRKRRSAAQNGTKNARVRSDLPEAAS